MYHKSSVTSSVTVYDDYSLIKTNEDLEEKQKCSPIFIFNETPHVVEL